MTGWETWDKGGGEERDVDTRKTRSQRKKVSTIKEERRYDIQRLLLVYAVVLAWTGTIRVVLQYYT